MVNIIGKSSYVILTIFAALWAWALVSAAIAPIICPAHVTLSINIKTRYKINLYTSILWTITSTMWSINMQGSDLHKLFQEV